MTNTSCTDLLPSILESSSDGIVVVAQDNTTLLVNHAFQELWRIPTENNATVGKPFTSLSDILDSLLNPETLLKQMQRSPDSETGQKSLLHLKDGRYFSCFFSRPLFSDGTRGRIWRFKDITEHQHFKHQKRVESRALEQIIGGVPLTEFLTDLALGYESLHPGMLCSILLLEPDGQHLKHGAAPSLPQAYCRAIDGVEIGDQTGSCGTAAYTKQTTIVSDIATDPLWRDYKLLALEYGLRACWSVPILSKNQRVLGTFAFYYTEPRSPSLSEQNSIELGAYLTSLVLERTEDKLSLNYLLQAVEQSTNAIEITDLHGNIEYVNEAFLHSSGYSRMELLGHNPRLIQSGKTPQATFESLWSSLNRGDAWQGEFINRKKDGSEYIESALITPIRGKENSAVVTHYLSIKEDVTERRRLENAAQKNLNMLDEMGKRAKVGAWEFDVATLKQTWTSEVYRIHEVSMDYEPTVSKSLDFYAPNSKQRIADMVQRAMELGEPFDAELEFITAQHNHRWVHVIGQAQQENGKTKIVSGTFQDITERKKSEAAIQKLAHFDALTGLPNRVLLQDRANNAFNIAHRSTRQAALLFLDLDHFKNINETLGYPVGDDLLLEIAKRLRASIRDEDTVSRVGGDEFTLILPNIDSLGAAQLVNNLLEVVGQSCQIGLHELTITASIGIAMYPIDGEDFDTLSKSATIAMSRAKHDSHNAYRFYTPEMQTHSARMLYLENELRHASERGQLQVHYQPQKSLTTGRIIGAEALLRWNHPELGTIPPSEFIPIAESSGQILPIGEWVLRTAIRQAKAWMDGGITPFVMAVNLSVVQFRQANLTDIVPQICAEEKFPPQYLELEITESVTLGNVPAAIAVITKLRALGIGVSIDDFGTGYSSLSYLKRFPVRKLKIDQSFVHDLLETTESRAIVLAVISLAKGMNLQVIAEGVETKAQLEFLREHGCDEVQGYYLSPALPAKQFESFVRNYECSDSVPFFSAQLSHNHN